METFSDWLENEIQRRDWKPADVASKAGISRGSVSNILSGLRQPGPDVCRAIAHALQVEEEEVFRRAGLLSPIPLAVAQEREALRIFRSLPADVRAIVFKIMHSLNTDLPVQHLESPLYVIAEENADYDPADRAGVPDAHPHRFRHTFAVQFLKNGGNGYVLQSLLGHSTMEMVKTYLKLAQQDLDDGHHRASPVDNWGL
jgi:integrase